MNKLSVDVGYRSVNHVGEELCGDHVEMKEIVDADGTDRTVVVLADGLGSGVKASILSTLTAKIIATMLAQGLRVEDCVQTIVQTLPVCSVRGVAYATFTILHIIGNEELELIQFDNPSVQLLRNGEVCEYATEKLEIGGKAISRSRLKLKENDVFVAMTDGCPHAGIGRAYNFGWRTEEIADFVLTLLPAGYTAKMLSTFLIDECMKLYGGAAGDDATACVLQVRRRRPMNLLFGPPENRDDCTRMMRLFFSKEGGHIVCGGTTSTIAASYLGKEIKTSLQFASPDIPPTAELEGVDLVTEGVITVNRVLQYAQDYIGDNHAYQDWCYGQDGASQICRLLFEEATDINFFVGRAINPAHQNPELPINFSIKMNLVKELSACLEAMGKRIKVSYF